MIPALGARTPPATSPGVRVVLDARPLQDPDRAPTTAAYLDGLLAACERHPIDGESFTLLLRSDLDDPTDGLLRLPVAGRRPLPPTRLLRSAAATVEPFLLRTATVGAEWRAGRSGAAGAVHHATTGVVPVLSGLPLVVTLLDLAPWELPHAYQRNPVARFGLRLRARLLRDAAAVIVGTDAVASDARRLLRLRGSRLRVVPLAPRAAFVQAGGGGTVSLASGGLPDRSGTDPRSERERLGLGERYFVYSGRFDARHDLSTLLRALGELAGAGRPGRLADGVEWPPRVLLVGATPDDRAALARAAARHGCGELLAYAPRLDPARLAGLVRGARAAILPALSEGAGLSAIEAIAAGTPVVASAVGALPEIVGAAGILVGPRDPGRLGAALASAWADDRLHAGLARRARAATHAARTWDDVARETRAIWAEAALSAGPRGRVAARPPRS